MCGAPNVSAGMKTPFAKPGVTLPNGMKLRGAKIRGVESNGMLCSERELMISDDHDGIIDNEHSQTLRNGHGLQMLRPRRWSFPSHRVREHRDP